MTRLALIGKIENIRFRDLLITPHRFFFGGGGYGCSCKQHKLCLKKAKKKCCCKDGYFALEDHLYQLIIVALLGLLIFFQGRNSMHLKMSQKCS